MGLCFSSPKATRRGTSRRNPNLHSPTQGKASEKASNKNKKKTKKSKNKIQWRHGRGIPYGKRIDFGYAKDFDNRYIIGRLLGHGQFGFTYVATDNNNGNRVAVKRIEKAKVKKKKTSSIWFEKVPFLLVNLKIQPVTNVIAWKPSKFHL